MLRDPLEQDRLIGHLGDLMRTACGDPHADAQLDELPKGEEGGIQIVSWGGKPHPVASVSELSDVDEAETTVLHEAGHWLLGHEHDPGYSAAVRHDREHCTATRGPWEQAADG